MKTALTILLFALIGGHSFGQQKYFEGVLTHHVTVQSKVQGLDDSYVYKLIGQGKELTIYIKDGNYRHSSSLSDIYYRQKEKRVYYKFKYLDTVYYQDYSSDTSKITDLQKSDVLTRVDNIDCKSISISTEMGTIRYFYAPSLLNNPVYDRDNTVGHFDVYTRETGGAIWLKQRAELNFGTITDSCVKIENKDVDDHIFELPALPVQKLGTTPLSSRPYFPGKDAGWLKYLQGQLDTKLAIKYVKLAKGESEASQRVVVQFNVREDGRLTDIDVVNKKEVHPKLAEEAMRVLRESPRWVPGTILGEKITFPFQQPVVFKVTRD